MGFKTGAGKPWPKDKTGGSKLPPNPPKPAT